MMMAKDNSFVRFSVIVIELLHHGNFTDKRMIFSDHLHFVFKKKKKCPDINNVFLYISEQMLRNNVVHERDHGWDHERDHHPLEWLECGGHFEQLFPNKFCGLLKDRWWRSVARGYFHGTRWCWFLSMEFSSSKCPVNFRHLPSTSLKLCKVL